MSDVHPRSLVQEAGRPGCPPTAIDFSSIMLAEKKGTESATVMNLGAHRCCHGKTISGDEHRAVITVVGSHVGKVCAGCGELHPAATIALLQVWL